jgi:hypothetical protein
LKGHKDTLTDYNNIYVETKDPVSVANGIEKMHRPAVAASDVDVVEEPFLK